MEHVHRPFALSQTGDRPGPEKQPQHHHEAGHWPTQRISPDTPIVYRLSRVGQEIDSQDPAGHAGLGPRCLDRQFAGHRSGIRCLARRPRRAGAGEGSGADVRMGLAQGLREIVDQILCVLDADGQAQQVGRHRRTDAFDTGTVFDQAFGSAQ